MIGAANGVSRSRYELEGAEPSRARMAEALAAIKAEETALKLEKQALFGGQRGPVSRIGEQGAGIDMLKSRLLFETEGISRDSLANGQMTTIFPSGGDNGVSHVLYINGINTDPAGARSEGQRIANAVGAPIDAIYQQSSIGNVVLREAAVLAARIAILGPFGGFGVTLAKARTDLMKKLENPEAAKTAANQIVERLGTPQSKNEVRLIGYSQGATISAQALRMVSSQLKQKYGATAAAAMMNRVHVLSVGGAARRSDFPAGIELTQIYNKYDIVSQFFGDNRTPLLQSLRLGADILKPHFYFSDPAALRQIEQWQEGRIQNQDIMLLDPKLRKEGTPVLRRIPIARTDLVTAV
jgi:hypothetical protein